MLKYWYPCRLVLSLLVMLPWLPGCVLFRFLPVQYTADPIESRVVDADTGQPIAGVTVVADWILKGGLVQLHHLGHANLMETITDAQGRFLFPGWQQWVSSGRLGAEDPTLILFKSGYQVQELRNDYISAREKHFYSPVIYSDWHGKTLKLKKFQGSLQEYAQHLRFLDITIGHIVRIGEKEGNCEWQKIPRLLTAVFQQQKLFKDRQVVNSLISIDDLQTNDQCGSPTTFLKEYLP